MKVTSLCYALRLRSRFKIYQNLPGSITSVYYLQLTGNPIPTALWGIRCRLQSRIVGDVKEQSGGISLEKVTEFLCALLFLSIFSEENTEWLRFWAI